MAGAEIRINPLRLVRRCEGRRRARSGIEGGQPTVGEERVEVNALGNLFE